MVQQSLARCSVNRSYFSIGFTLLCPVQLSFCSENRSGQLRKREIHIVGLFISNLSTLTRYFECLYFVGILVPRRGEVSSQCCGLFLFCVVLEEMVMRCVQSCSTFLALFYACGTASRLTRQIPTLWRGLYFVSFSVLLIFPG